MKSNQFLTSDSQTFYHFQWVRCGSLEKAHFSNDRDEKSFLIGNDYQRNGYDCFSLGSGFAAGCRFT